MIYKFKDTAYENYLLEIFQQEQETVTFQSSSSTGEVVDITLSKEQLFDMIGALLTIQAKLKGTRPNG